MAHNNATGAPGEVPSQLSDPGYQNWQRVGLGLIELRNAYLPLFEQHGRALYQQLLHEWTQLPVTRGEPAWTDTDIPMIQSEVDPATGALSKATKYVVSKATQQRMDMAAVIRRHHVSSTSNYPTGVQGPVRPDGDPNPKSDCTGWVHCDASRWGDPDAWLEVLKAYSRAGNLGSKHHVLISEKVQPDQLDATGLINIMRFCDAFTSSFDQSSSDLPADHPLHAAQKGHLQKVQDVRNSAVCHSPDFTVCDDEARAALIVLLEALQDSVDRGCSSCSVAVDTVQQLLDGVGDLNQSFTLPEVQLREVVAMLRPVQDPEAAMLERQLHILKQNHASGPVVFHSVMSGARTHSAITHSFQAVRTLSAGSANRSAAPAKLFKGLRVRFLPEDKELEVVEGTTVVIGRRGRQEEKLETGEFMQGQQLAGGHVWYVGLDDETLDGTHCVLRWLPDPLEWEFENPARATTYGTRAWSDNKQKFKKLPAGHKVELSEEWKRFQLGKRSEVDVEDESTRRENHEIEVRMVGMGLSSSMYSG